jgi:hypothetical protein
MFALMRASGIIRERLRVEKEDSKQSRNDQRFHETLPLVGMS